MQPPWIILFAQLTVGAPPAPVLPCSFLPSVVDSLQKAHYASNSVSQVAAKRSVDVFIESLDPSRVLLLKKDVDLLRQKLMVIFSTMEDGDCKALSDAAGLTVRRVRDNEIIAKKLLDQKYKLDEKVELDLDPKKRGYAKTEKERADLVRKLIHFQVLNQIVAGTDLEKAKQRVLHRYELATKRAQEQRAENELPGLFAEAFAGALDPHSAFLSAETLADFQIHMRLSLEGIGALLRSEDGFTVIQSLVPGGQADKQNRLRPKDKIIAVAQENEEPVSVIDMALRDVVQMIRGKKGTKVTLTILREGGQTETFDVTIVRDKIDVKEQAAKITYEERTVGKRKLLLGVLDLPSFYGGDDEGRSSYEDVRKLLSEARSKKVDGLVLDLSENGGGLLKDAVRISGLFLRKGAIVATRSSSDEREVLEDEDEGIDYRGPLVVLTSPISASASEILAAALQDYRRAVIVGGEHTFGKGTVQMLTQLPAGLGALKVTTGMFFRPSGQSTQQVGVRSDFIVPSIYNRPDIGEVKLDYSLPPQSIEAFASGESNWSDPKKRWTPVTEDTKAKLAKRSATRVAKDAMLQKILKEIDEETKKDRTIKLSELRHEAKKRGSDDDARDEYERMKAAFVKEGVNVLVDLISEQK